MTNDTRRDMPEEHGAEHLAALESMLSSLGPVDPPARLVGDVMQQIKSHVQEPSVATSGGVMRT